jgi:hypothetical protein
MLGGCLKLTRNCPSMRMMKESTLSYFFDAFEDFNRIVSAQSVLLINALAPPGLRSSKLIIRSFLWPNNYIHDVNKRFVLIN